MQVVCQEQAAAAAAAAQRQEAHKERQVTKVLEASRMRSQRAARVAKLKVGLSHVRSIMLQDFGLVWLFWAKKTCHPHVKAETFQVMKLRRSAKLHWLGALRYAMFI